MVGSSKEASQSSLPPPQALQSSHALVDSNMVEEPSAAPMLAINGKSSGVYQKGAISDMPPKGSYFAAHANVYPSLLAMVRASGKALTFTALAMHVPFDLSVALKDS